LSLCAKKKGGFTCARDIRGDSLPLAHEQPGEAGVVLFLLFLVLLLFLLLVSQRLVNLLLDLRLLQDELSLLEAVFLEVRFDIFPAQFRLAVLASHRGDGVVTAHELPLSGHAADDVHPVCDVKVLALGVESAVREESGKRERLGESVRVIEEEGLVVSRMVALCNGRTKNN